MYPKIGEDNKEDLPSQSFSSLIIYTRGCPLSPDRGPCDSMSIFCETAAFHLRTCIIEPHQTTTPQRTSLFNSNQLKAMRAVSSRIQRSAGCKSRRRWLRSFTASRQMILGSPASGLPWMISSEIDHVASTVKLKNALEYHTSLPIPYLAIYEGILSVAAEFTLFCRLLR